MLVSYNYLSKLVDLSNLDVKEVADKITFAGTEIEGMTRLAYASNLEIGEVLECVDHPDSDHLHVCQVKLSDGVRTIVCGAPNIRKGLKVIVAKEGANLEKIGVVIKKGVIRGVESNGMICSLKELGVPENLLREDQCKGIEELPSDAPVGEKEVLKYLGLDDVILEFTPTPDRGDTLSLLSLAKEVAACLDRPLLFKENEYHFDEVKSNLTCNSLTSKCKYFNIKRIDGIKVKESPKWLKEVLISMNFRPINNIVDIGNYVMLLYGQPVHMYDVDKLNSFDFEVRDDFETKFKALDEKEYDVKKGDIVITNNGEISCLGGVMGGYNTMISEESKNIAVEAALFDSTTIRLTSRRVNNISDSSTRFVRGVDSTRALKALDLITSLLIEYADAKVIYETVTYGNPVINNKEITLTTEKTNKVLGTCFTTEEIASVFRRLDFKYSVEGSTFKVVPPTYRPDITISEDLIEEVIRILGFDNLKSTFPVTSNVGAYSDVQSKRLTIRNELLHFGLNEALTYSLIDENVVNDFNLFQDNKNVEPVKVMHPMTRDHAILRKSIIPSLLMSLNYNLAHKNSDISLFEVSKIYTSEKENEHLGMIINGNLNSYSWRTNTPVDFYLIKGIVTSIFNKLNIDTNRYQLVEVESDNKFLHPGRSAYIKLGKKIIGYVGQIHPLMENKYDVPQTLVCEINLDDLFDVRTSKIKFKAPSIYPTMKRDMALVVKEDLKVSEIINCIKKNSKSMVSDITVFDVYQGEHVEKGFKSVALSLTYSDETRTLKDEEVTNVHNNIVAALNKQLNATLRG